MSGRVWILAMVLAIGCSPSESSPKRTDGEPQRERDEPAPVQVSDTEPGREITLGPAENASLEDRRAAALAMLTDGTSAQHLPLDVVDPGEQFDPQLVDRLAPRASAPQVHHGKPTLGGGGELDVDVVRRIMRAHDNVVRDCYTEALKSTPALVGRLRVDFTIEVDGAVANAKVGESTLKDDAVERCVVEAVGEWRFPKPKGGTLTVEYSYAFTI